MSKQLMVIQVLWTDSEIRPAERRQIRPSFGTIDTCYTCQ